MAQHLDAWPECIHSPAMDPLPLDYKEATLSHDLSLLFSPLFITLTLVRYSLSGTSSKAFLTLGLLVLR